MAARITIQDIADALGVSRNTVSKAINNTGVLAEATRERVLKKAVEMGYKQFSYIQISDPGNGEVRVEIPSVEPEKKGGIIALLTTNTLSSSHFSSTMLDRVQRELTAGGYSFMIFRVRDDNLENLTLPAGFFPNQVSGIMCVEVFHMAYSEFLCSLGLPMLFIDQPVSLLGKKLPSDVLLMNNETEIYTFTEEMIRRGKTRFGFVGETLHCMSFYERYRSLREALHIRQIPWVQEYCISTGITRNHFPSAEEYQAFLQTAVSRLNPLPEVFLCANDFVAMDLLQVFRRLGIRVPEDVLLCGFDDSPESRVLTPSLTTIHIHTQIMGYSAVQLLLSRIQSPSLNYRTVHTETTLIYRESTGD